MIHKWNVQIPALSGEKIRQGYVYLPEGYEENPDRRYPVLYMFDGHNVFFDADATYGKSWGMRQYLEKYKPGLIIVAIACNDEGFRRLNEYTPFPFTYKENRFCAQGEVYMDWLVNTLKPAVDERLRTLSDPEHTIIAGSSMGGLMSLYAVTAYNHIFKKAACLSPSLWTNPRKVAAMISAAEYAPGTNIYMDYGSEELANHSDILPGGETILPILQKTADKLLQKGVQLSFRIVPGGTHCEASWEKQIPIFMHCLELV